jgi:hypothetical protein
MMRRLAVIVGIGAVFFALVAIALASPTPVVTYTSPIKQSGKPKPHKPVPVAYDGVLDVKNPDGTQPATAPTTTLYFAKQLVNNAKYFPSCSVSDIDGKQTVPAKCKAAQVGKGTAASQAGQPGTPSAINEPLTVTAYNGPKGKQFLLVLNASTPVAVQNRVVPATLGPGGGQFGYTLKFQVPADLQSQLGLQIALTHFDVVTSGKTRTVKVKGKKKKLAYLMLTKCPANKTLPSKAVVQFNNDAGQPGGPTVTSTGTFKCK